ncbi:MAG: hypothetical protein IJ072_07860 [Oscillospiraceae bacterium]|nr:hypothetical protein [Oscillospiraceae bacterium]
MKKNNVIRIFALVLALMLMLAALSACGGKKSGSPADDAGNGDATEATESGAAEVAGAEETWGNITLLIPEGMTLKGGSLIDEDDPNVLSVTLDENETHYIMVNVVEEETAKTSIDTTKEMNASSDPEDVTVDACGVTWTGVAYKYAGMSDCFQLNGNVNGKTVLLSGGWFAYNDPTTTAVLGSLKVA